MITLFIGIVGMALLLVAFVMNELHKWKSNDKAYELCNIIGAVLLTIYAWLIRSYPFLALNAIWALVATRNLLLSLKKK